MAGPEQIPAPLSMGRQQRDYLLLLCPLQGRALLSGPCFLSLSSDNTVFTSSNLIIFVILRSHYPVHVKLELPHTHAS